MELATQLEAIPKLKIEDHLRNSPGVGVGNKERRLASWEESDELWKRVEPLLARGYRQQGRKYLREPGGGGKPLESCRVFEGAGPRPQTPQHLCADVRYKGVSARRWASNTLSPSRIAFESFSCALKDSKYLASALSLFAR